MSLLDENLSKRTFAFATVAEVCSGKRVLPLDDSATHRRVVAAIEKTVAENLSKIKAFPPRIPPIHSDSP
jgi:transposase